MSDFTIKEIGNGWILTGPREQDLPVAGEESIYVPNLVMLGEVLIIWQTEGLDKAVDKYREQCERR